MSASVKHLRAKNSHVRCFVRKIETNKASRRLIEKLVVEMRGRELLVDDQRAVCHKHEMVNHRVCYHWYQSQQEDYSE